MQNYYDFKEYEEYYRSRDPMSERVIFHSDLNNFFASVEAVDDPSLKNVPLAVCGDEEARHGIVLAKNYIAKKYGIRTGDTVREAKQKCPYLIIRQTNYSNYVKYSRLVREIYLSYATKIEMFGIDEAWIDVSDLVRIRGGNIYDEGKRIAYEIKDKVKQNLGLTVSIGVSFNKTLAKLASDMKKPDAVTVLSYEEFSKRISQLPVEELLFIGRSAKHKLNRLKIFTIGDLASQSRYDMQMNFGKVGCAMWDRANGYDFSDVQYYHNEEKTASISNSITLPRDVTTQEEVASVLLPLSEAVGEELRTREEAASVVKLFVRHSDLSSVVRQTVIFPTDNTLNIFQYAKDLFLENVREGFEIRSLGVGVEGLCAKRDVQQDIFNSGCALDEIIDSLRRKYGDGVIKRGNVMSQHDITSFDKRHVAFNKNL